MVVYYGSNGWFDLVRLTPNGPDIETYLNSNDIVCFRHPDTGEEIELVYG